MNTFHSPCAQLLRRLESMFRLPVQGHFSWPLPTAQAPSPQFTLGMLAFAATMGDVRQHAELASLAARKAKRGPVRRVAAARARILWAMVAAMPVRKLP